MLASALSGLPLPFVLKNLRPFIWLFFFTFSMHALLTSGRVLWTVPYLDLEITAQGLALGAFFSLRLAVVIVAASLMTLTTAPMELTGGLERLLGPLRRFRFPVHELAMMVTISLRFIPVLIDEAERLHKAQLARGADFSGGPIRRARSLIPLLVPLFVSAFDRADRLALAMESRCYRGGDRRTSFHELAFARRDLLAGLAVLVAVLAIAVLPRFGSW
jgi:energy-coupling factor transport system permease protein